jgi:hypothetical protein
VYKNRGSADDGGTGERGVWVVLASRATFCNVGRGLVLGDREERDVERRWSGNGNVRVR